MTSQSQTGGMGSSNLQIANVNVGLSYSDVRAIYMDLFEANIAKTRAVAKEAAERRAGELVEDLVKALEERKVADLNGFNHPEKQNALIDAQRAIALSGDDDLRSMLVDAIVEIAGEPERSLKSIVLQEAIKVLPNLNKRQLEILTAAFLVRFVSHANAESGKMYFDMIESGLGQDPEKLNSTDGDFRHIEYCRCGVVEVTELSLLRIFHVEYPGLITKGFDAGEVAERLGTNVPIHAIMPCLYDDKRLQVAANTVGTLRKKAEIFGWEEAQTSELEKMLLERLPDQGEFEAWLAEQGPVAQRLAERWGGTPLKSLKLTSVGIAIGHAFCASNGFAINNLSIWL